MTFIGNTLGLSKAVGLNEPGTPGTVIDSVGAFTTIDATQTVGSYANLSSGIGSPAGTTLDWTRNSSSAELSLPPGIIILHAELIWSGSFGYYASAAGETHGTGVDPECVLAFAGGPVRFTTPDGVTHLVSADPATALESQNPALDVQTFFCGGNYTRSQDVTPLLTLLADTNGTYTVGGVPATVSQYEDHSNTAGWTLAIVYRNPASAFVNNMALFLGAQQASRAAIVEPAIVSGFCAQTNPGLKSARLLVSAIEGDADITGDNMQFGPDPGSLTMLSGPNNPINNFFASQINDDNGNLISTTGTFCQYNQDPFTTVLVPNGRQGYDITNVDCSSTISSGQTVAYAIGTTAGDDYTVNAIGVQISVDAPSIVPIKYVNNEFSTLAKVGDILTFTMTLENDGTLDGLSVILQDTLPEGLLFVPGSVTLNAVAMPLANPQSGVHVGTIALGETDVLEFNAKVIAPPLTGTFFVNSGTVGFDYAACATLINTQNLSNVVVVNFLDPPIDFTGTLMKCKFFYKHMYRLETSWVSQEIIAPGDYEIYSNGKLVAVIPAEGPYLFDTCLSSSGDASSYSIVTVFPNGVRTAPTPIRILHE
jgi:uncharacterized repeat protein (TIGR01451 family)